MILGTDVRSLLALLALAVLLALPGSAQERAPRSAGQDRTLGERVHPVILDNGWQFLLLSRPDVPSISFETCVRTGPAYEPPGSSGMTDLIRQLLFTGSDRIGTTNWEAERAALGEVDAAQAALLVARAGGQEDAITAAEEQLSEARELAASFADPGEYRRILSNAGCGATLGASLTPEETRFTVSLPSNRLELWCWMEAERFSRPAMRGLCAERDALLEHRSSRGGDPPTVSLGEALRRAAWAGVPGYEGPEGGLPEDLALLSRISTLEFFQANYGAESLTTAVVGDFNPATLEPMLERYFSALPSGKLPEPADAPGNPPSGARRVELEDRAAPQLMIGWRVPPPGQADRPAIELALRILGGARSSRLQRRLVRERSVAIEVEVSAPEASSRLGGLATIRAVPAVDVSCARLEKLIQEEIAELAREGPRPEELTGAQRAMRAEHLRRLRENDSVAAGLIDYQVLAGDWSRFFDVPAETNAVTANDIQRVLSAYLSIENGTVATLKRVEEN